MLLLPALACCCLWRAARSSLALQLELAAVSLRRRLNAALADSEFLQAEARARLKQHELQQHGQEQEQQFAGSSSAGSALLPAF